MDVPRAIQHLSACWCASFRPDLPSPALTWGVCGSVCFILPIHRWRDQTWSNRTVNYGSMLMGCSAHARHTHVWLHMLVWKIRHIDSYAIFGCSIPSELHFCPRSHKDALYIHLDLLYWNYPGNLLYVLYSSISIIVIPEKVPCFDVVLTKKSMGVVLDCFLSLKTTCLLFTEYRYMHRSCPVKLYMYSTVIKKADTKHNKNTLKK